LCDNNYEIYTFAAVPSRGPQTVCLISVSAAAGAMLRHQTNSSSFITSIKHHPEQRSSITHYQITPQIGRISVYKCGVFLCWPTCILCPFLVFALLALLCFVLHCMDCNFFVLCVYYFSVCQFA